MDARRFAASAFGEAFRTTGAAGCIAYRPAPLPRRLDPPDDEPFTFEPD